MSKGTNINTDTLTWEATKALMSLDNSFVGTESYMGMSYFWPTDFKHLLRDATYAKRRRVHALVLAAGVPVQAGGWLGDPSGIDGVTPFVHEAYRAAIQKVCKGDIGPWHRLAEWEARQPAPEAPEAEEAPEAPEAEEAPEATTAIITNKRLDSVHPTTGRGVYTCTVECSGCGHSRRYGFAGWCGLLCSTCGAEMERLTPAEMKAQEAEEAAKEIRKNAGMVAGAMEATKEALKQMQRDCDSLEDESDRMMRNGWGWGTPQRKAWKRRAFVARNIDEKLEEVIQMIRDDWEGVEHDWSRLPSAPENRREAWIEAMKAEEAAPEEHAAQ